MNKLNKQEEYFKDLLQAEVSSPSSYYFGETIYVLCKAIALNQVWYRVRLDYQIGLLPNVSAWFKEDELEFEV